MAPSLLLLPIAALVTVAAPEGPPPSQPPHAWNLSVGTGAGGYVEFVDAFAGTSLAGYDEHSRDRFQLNVRADRELGRWLKVGVAWVHNRWRDDLEAGGVVVGAVENRVDAVMADVTCTWVRRDWMVVYSALAVGGGWWREDGTGVAADRDRTTGGPAFQLRYAGLALGGEHVRAFVDLGIGFEGLIVGGLVLRI